LLREISDVRVAESAAKKSGNFSVAIRKSRRRVADKMEATEEPPDSEMQSILYGKAIALYCDQKYKESIEIFDRFLLLDPLNANVNQLRENAEAMAQIEVEELHKRDKKNKICIICRKIFKKTNTLYCHMFSHRELGHHCSLCKRSFSRKGDLDRHKTTHSNEKNFECPNCHCRFKEQRYLKNHMVSHSDVYSFQCSYCPKKFKHKRTHKFHESLHTNTLKYYCDICGREFANLLYLRNHMKKMHLNKRKPRKSNVKK